MMVDRTNVEECADVERGGTKTSCKRCVGFCKLGSYFWVTSLLVCRAIGFSVAIRVLIFKQLDVKLREKIVGGIDLTSQLMVWAISFVMAAASSSLVAVVASLQPLCLHVEW